MCHYMWNRYLQAVHRDGICTCQVIIQELRSLKQFVICPADHHPYRAHLCCRRHFHFLLFKTFMAPEVFARCSVGWNAVFPRIIQDLQVALPPHLRKLVSSHGTCPYAYILPKPSKFFESARPNISYTGSWNCRLGQVVGGIVLQLCCSLLHNISLDQDVLQIMKTIQSAFSEVPVQLDQQDLSGFFNSVPHSRMIHCVVLRLLAKSTYLQNLVSANRLLCNARYVDNRAMIGVGTWRKAPVWSTFTNLQAYGSPIILEEVSDPILPGSMSTSTRQLLLSGSQTTRIIIVPN